MLRERNFLMETYKEWEDYFIDGTDVLKNKLGITEKE